MPTSKHGQNNSNLPRRTAALQLRAIEVRPLLVREIGAALSVVTISIAMLIVAIRISPNISGALLVVSLISNRTKIFESLKKFVVSR